MGQHAKMAHQYLLGKGWFSITVHPQAHRFEGQDINTQQSSQDWLYYRETNLTEFPVVISVKGKQ